MQENSRIDGCDAESVPVAPGYRDALPWYIFMGEAHTDGRVHPLGIVEVSTVCGYLDRPAGAGRAASAVEAVEPKNRS